MKPIHKIVDIKKFNQISIPDSYGPKVEVYIFPAGKTDEDEILRKASMETIEEDKDEDIIWEKYL